MANTVQLTKNGQPVFPVTDESLVTGLNYRPYDSENPNGMGYLVLKKNKTFAEQVTQENTIYEIRYNFDLNEASVQIHAGCVLKFDGGSLSNGTLSGNDTRIDYTGTIFDGIAISGTWIVPEIRSSMFADLSNNGLKNLFALQNADFHNDLIVDEGDYVIGFSSQDGGASALVITDKTDCIINGTISLDSNPRSQEMLTYGYRMIELKGNSSLSGNGMLIGDIAINKENTESGHGVYVQDGNVVEVSGITIKDCAGDCIGVGPRNKSVFVHDVEISNWNRNSVAVVNCENFKMENIYAHDGGYTSPFAIIDLEPNANMSVGSANIKNVIAENVGVGFSCTNEYGTIGDVNIENIDLKGCVREAFIISGAIGIGNYSVRNAKVYNFPAGHGYETGDIIRMAVYKSSRFENLNLDVSNIATMTSYGCTLFGKNNVFEHCTFVGNKIFAANINDTLFRRCSFIGDAPLWPSASSTLRDIIFDECSFTTGNIELRNRGLKVKNCLFTITAFNNTGYGVIRLDNSGSPQDEMIFRNNRIVVQSNQTPATKDFLLLFSGPNIICCDNVFDNQGGGAGGGIYVNCEKSEIYNNKFFNFSASARKIVFNNPLNLIDVGSIPKAGKTTNRPALQSDYYFGGAIGTTYFDTDIGKMIVWNGTAWVNMDGSALS